MRRTFEELLVEHCSPTLAGVKTANLFCYKVEQENLDNTIEYWNDVLNPYGIKVVIIKNCRHKNNCLVYVYREKRLQQDLHQCGVNEFLSALGYSGCKSTIDAINVLSLHLSQCDTFPHEIGLFLGYPLHDVRGFIINQGKNFCCSGLWKVYENPEQAQKCFAQYKKCTEIYRHLYQNGRSIIQLSVAA